MERLVTLAADRIASTSSNNICESNSTLVDSDTCCHICCIERHVNSQYRYIKKLIKDMSAWNQNYKARFRLWRYHRRQMQYSAGPHSPVPAVSSKNSRYFKNINSHRFITRYLPRKGLALNCSYSKPQLTVRPSFHVALDEWPATTTPNQKI